MDKSLRILRGHFSRDVGRERVPDLVNLISYTLKRNRLLTGLLILGTRRFLLFLRNSIYAHFKRLRLQHIRLMLWSSIKSKFS